jgi:hypothetical protein
MKNFAIIDAFVVIYCLLFNILMVTMVSIVKNKAKMIKKFIFSLVLFMFPECVIGYKTAKEIIILILVNNKKV